MKKILIPTDFSENSWNAIKYAVAFFKKTKCTFYILHIASTEDVVIDDALFKAENEQDGMLTST